MSEKAVHAVQTLALVALAAFALLAVLALLAEPPAVRVPTVTSTPASPLSARIHSAAWITTSANFSNDSKGS